MDYKHSALLIAVVAVVTLLLRVLPFIIFNGKKETPKMISYLGKVLPFAIMGMLVVYCLKGASVSVYPFALPEIIASALVVLLHLWKRNTLLSVGGGTIIYMILVQTVFA